MLAQYEGLSEAEAVKSKEFRRLIGVTCSRGNFKKHMLGPENNVSPFMLLADYGTN